MTFDGAWTKMKALRDIVVIQTRRVKPFLERFRPAPMAKCVAVPNAAQRRHFVESCTPPGLQRESGVRAYRYIQHVPRPEKLLRDTEACGRGELVVCVKRSWVASFATLLREDDLAPVGQRGNRIRVGRRLKRLDVERERV